MARFLLAAAFAVLLLGGCSRRIDMAPPASFFSVLITSVDSDNPAGFLAGSEVTFTAAVTGGMPPYTYEWNFGGLLEPNIQSSPAGHTTSISGHLRDLTPGDHFTVQVTAREGNGIQAMDTHSFTFGALPVYARPVITGATFEREILIVGVTDEDDDRSEEIAVAATASNPGVEVYPPECILSGDGLLTAAFSVRAADPLAGASGTIAVSATDGSGETLWPNPVAVSIPPAAIGADMLVVRVPQQHAALGEAVQVIVEIGPPAHPFQYMSGVGLEIEADADLVSGSYDVGAVDAIADLGSVNPVDGIWAAVNPATFIHVPAFIAATDLGTGRERWDFNVTPIDGRDVTGQGGALFNCSFTFSTPGIKTFGFSPTFSVDAVRRTYYADGGTEYLWGDTASNGGFAAALIVDQPR